MKTTFALSGLFALYGSSSALCQSQNQPASPPETAQATKPATPAKLNLVRYRGKTGKPTTNVKVSTRSGDQSAIRIVAIAPGNEGITFKPQPRFWWHQNEPTLAGELEFVLTRLSAESPSVVLRRPVPPMKAGYNVIDLSNRNVNPDSVTMESGSSYQWTINLRNGLSSSPVYSRATLREAPNPTQTGASLDEQLGTLSQQENWYELFDLTCSAAELEVPPGSKIELRREILTDIKLFGEIK